MKLFKYEGYRVVIDPMALALKPFKRIWDRDKSEHKNKAISELGFIYFFCDPRSDFVYIPDEETRMDEIKLAEGIKPEWQPDKEVKQAMELYVKLTQTTVTGLLEDTRCSVEKIRKALRDMDFMERDEKGKPVYTINHLVDAINKIPELVKKIIEAEKAVSSEIEESSRVRGGGKLTIYDDGLV